MCSEQPIAIFDFCETLVSFQSADAYMDYVFMKTGFSRIIKARKMILEILRKIHLMGAIQKITGQNTIYKKAKLKLFKGLPYQKMDQLAESFYTEIIQPNLIHETIAELKKKKAEGYRIVMVSGAFDIYLKYFCNDNNITDMLATSLSFKDGLFQGKWVDVDCMGQEKIRCYEEWQKKQTTTKKPNICFSDSISDLPILQYCEEAVVVSKKKHQNWIDQYNFKEIIWGN